MSQVKIKAYVCIDEHGNYKIIGSSTIKEDNQHAAIAIIEDGIKVEGVNSNTTSFQVQIELPTPKEKVDEIKNVSQ